MRCEPAPDSSGIPVAGRAWLAAGGQAIGNEPGPTAPASMRGRRGIKRIAGKGATKNLPNYPGLPCFVRHNYDRAYYLRAQVKALDLRYHMSIVNHSAAPSRPIIKCDMRASYPFFRESCYTYVHVYRSVRRNYRFTFTCSRSGGAGIRFVSQA